jgi:hypothetical protein
MNMEGINKKDDIDDGSWKMLIKTIIKYIKGDKKK